jgi:general secretion pathway protein D
MIKALLARIDSMPEQVLMQIMIAEATLGDNTEFGLEFSGEALNNSKYLGLVGTQFAGLNPTSPATSTDQGFQYFIQNKDNADKFAYIRALAGKGNTKILSSPQLVVKSGTEASIDVGKDVPIITRTQTDTTNVSTSNEVEYRKVGVLLKLTPVITEGGLISLDIDQEVSQQGPNVAAGNSTYPSFLERHIITTLAIRNGGTIVMGGIIDETSRENTDSAPWIADIPVLAKILGYTTQKKDRIEMLMMLTGIIVDEKTDIQKVIQRYKKSVAMFKKFKKDNAPEKDKK